MKYLVIGGSSGIGLAVTQTLVEKGHEVWATYNSTSPTTIKNANWLQLNVLEEVSLEGLPENLDGLVYCPGGIHLFPFARLKPQSFVDDYQLQVVGAVKVIQHVLDRLNKSQSASIVLFSTVAVQTGLNFHAQVAATKGAIEGLTRALAAEFAPKVRVNAVAPSLTDTPLASKLLNSEQKREANGQRHPMKRIGTPQDIASAVVYLLSEESSWVTGQILHVDGGLSSIKN